MNEQTSQIDDVSAKRTVLVLVIAQAFLGSQMPMLFVVAGLAGQQITPYACLSTLPISLIVFGSMTTAPWLSKIMQLYGRKKGFIIGAFGGFIGAAIGAEEVQIWTDIDGMHNNDPRVVKNTRPIAMLTFDEAAELAYFGAKILHPTSIVPARNSGVPVVLKNTMAPEKLGTVISNEPSGNHIKALAAKDGITAIKIKSDRMLLAYGFLRQIFEVFERHKISIDMITTSEVAVSLTIDDDRDISELVEELGLYGKVEVDTNQTIVCIVGHMLQSESGHAAKIFNSLKDITLRMISYGGSKNNVSILIDTEYKTQALKALNQGLFDLGE